METKDEYSLNVTMPVNEAVKRVMEMPGSAAAEGVYFSGRIKRVSKSTHIYLQQVSESEIKFSDSISWSDRAMLAGECIFNSLDKYDTQITAKFRIGTTSINVFKIAIWTLLPLIPVAAWFLYRLLLDTGTNENLALEITIIAGLFSLITPILISLILWLNSGRIKKFLEQFSEALGVGNKWI